MDNLANLEAERDLLAALLCKQDLINDVFGKIQPEHFYSKKNQLVYKAIENVLKNNETVDIISVSDDLTRSGNIKKVGGRAFINDIALSFLTSVQFESWINSIKEKYTLRKLRAIAQDIIDKTEIASKSSEILDSVQSEIYDMSFQSCPKEGKDFNEILAERYSEIALSYDELQSTGELVLKNVLSTGFKQFDKFLRGGFKDGELTLLAARSRVGKTALEVALEQGIALNNDIAIVDYQLETNEEELADRHLASMTGIKKGYFTYVNKLEKYHFDSLSSSLNKITTPFKIFTNPDFNIIEIESKAKQFFNKVGKKGIIFIDNLQIMEDVNKGRSDIEISSNITRDCKKLAKRLNVPVVLLCQLVKEAEDNSEPILKNIRGSMQVIANADNIILMHRDTDDKETIADVKLLFEKVRKGQTGELMMKLDLSTNRFTEVPE